MKAKKQRVGTKAKIRVLKERETHMAAVIFLVFILLILIFLSYIIYSFLIPFQDQTTDPASSQLKAAIVDQLSLTFPNQSFIETATNTLRHAGYNVDYYSGEKVTVQFYRNLPTHGYGFVILRVHSTATDPDWTECPVTLFTSERYDPSKHVYEQLTDQLDGVAFSQQDIKDGIIYFGINPSFITKGMNGNFQNTIIVMMGCEGLDNTLMAKAFTEKGAKVYIGWNKVVTASHTDIATTYLLQHFLLEKLALKEAVIEAFNEVSIDPTHNSLLAYYPPEIGEQTIDNIVVNSTTK